MPDPAVAMGEAPRGASHRGSAHGVDRLPGDPGVWMFITADTLMFGVFFFVFTQARLAAPAAYEEARRQLSPGFGLFDTLLLLTSGWLVALAIESVRELRPSEASARLKIAMALGVGFAISKLTEWTLEIRAGHTITSGEFFAYYFAFTAIHFVHLLLGLGVLTWCVMRLGRGPIDQKSILWIESGGCYWHMVDLLWIVLFPMLYLVGSA